MIARKLGLTVALIAIAMIVGYYYVVAPLLAPPEIPAVTANNPSVVPLFSAADLARDRQRLNDMNKLREAFAGYFKDHSAYPPAPEGTTCGSAYDNLDGLADALVPQYLDGIPKDPKPPACVYNYDYMSDTANYAILVHLATIDPTKYSDHWCIGAAAGPLPELAAYLPCPDKAGQP